MRSGTSCQAAELIPPCGKINKSFVSSLTKKPNEHAHSVRLGLILGFLELELKTKLGSQFDFYVRSNRFLFF